MKHTIYAAVLAIIGFSSSANSTCLEKQPYPAGPVNVKVSNLYVNTNGNYYVKLSNGSTYWIDGSQAGAHNMYQFLLVSWQMGATFDVFATCSWVEQSNTAEIVSVNSK